MIFRRGRTWEREFESNLFSRVKTSVDIPNTVIVSVLGFGFSFVQRGFPLCYNALECK